MEQRTTARLNEAAILVRLSNCSPRKNKKAQICSRFLLDTSLSSSPISSASTRHSVTSRIDRNSRPLSYLIFSTRQLNATLEKREHAEKFNTCIRFFAASDSFPKTKTAGYFTPCRNFNQRSLTPRVGLQ
jgi:hypothetical protein